MHTAPASFYPNLDSPFTHPRVVYPSSRLNMGKKNPGNRPNYQPLTLQLPLSL